MNLTLRKAAPEDAAALDQVLQALGTYERSDLPKAQTLIEKIAENPEKYLLAAVDEDSGTLCGSLLGVVFEDVTDDCRPILLVENVAVLPAFQGRGVGKAMFREIETWARGKNCRYAILTSGLQRTGAHGFYKAIGYQEVKGFKKYF